MTARSQLCSLHLIVRRLLGASAKQWNMRNCPQLCLFAWNKYKWKLQSRVAIKDILQHRVSHWMPFQALNPVIPGLLGPGWPGRAGEHLFQSSNLVWSWLCHDAHSSAFPHASWLTLLPPACQKDELRLWVRKRPRQWSPEERKKQSNPDAASWHWFTWGGLRMSGWHLHFWLSLGRAQSPPKTRVGSNFLAHDLYITRNSSFGLASYGAVWGSSEEIINNYFRGEASSRSRTLWWLTHLTKNCYLSNNPWEIGRYPH